MLAVVLLMSLFPSQDLVSQFLSPRSDWSFFVDQTRFARFRTARGEKEDGLRQLLAERGLPAQPERVFLRVFKRERVLEVWVGHKDTDTFALLKTYPVCAVSGVLGPKRRQGDRQIPEGFYTIDRFNPASNYYLSLGLDYPNRSDRILGDKRDPGDDIFIHGNCVTIGCVPITDPMIKELYLLCVVARCNGQKDIPVHIFPARLTDANLAALLEDHPQHETFWRNLQPVYVWFERHKSLPAIRVDDAGGYEIQAPAP